MGTWGRWFQHDWKDSLCLKMIHALEHLSLKCWEINWYSMFPSPPCHGGWTRLLRGALLSYVAFALLTQLWSVGHKFCLQSKMLRGWRPSGQIGCARRLFAESTAYFPNYGLLVRHVRFLPAGSKKSVLWRDERVSLWKGRLGAVVLLHSSWRLQSKIPSRFLPLWYSCSRRDIGSETNRRPFPPALGVYELLHTGHRNACDGEIPALPSV